MAALPDPERTRRNIGLALYLVGMGFGGLLLFMVLIGLPVLSGDLDMVAYICVGAFLALPAGAMYLTVPRLLDRYDPEPWYALLGCLFWGGVAATGYSAIINSLVHEGLGGQTGEVVSTVVSAPLVEEFWKGLGVLGVFYFLRREFDGVVDGIIYATFTAIGFATIENVLYYGRAAGEDMLGATFILRGVITPWCHPVYTSLIGIGLGLARETEKSWVRWLAPPLGYFGAVLLHAMWNGSATIADLGSQGPGGDNSGAVIFICSLPLWFLLVLTFLIMVIVLVRRRGRIIREYLQDEVALGHVTPEEVDIVCSSFGLMTMRMRHGSAGVELVRAMARLALSKWHTVRAQNQDMSTVSMDFIVPLRQRIFELKHQIYGQGHARPR